jgi:thiol:disulfide interchange protein
MNLVKKLFGLMLMLLGLYFLGRNIFFTTSASGYWGAHISATGAVLSLMLGIWLVVCAGRRSRNLGWLLIGLGIVLVFMSSSIVLQPTSLWTFCAAFAASVSGYRLITVGRLSF